MASCWLLGPWAGAGLGGFLEALVTLVVLDSCYLSADISGDLGRPADGEAGVMEVLGLYWCLIRKNAVVV